MSSSEQACSTVSFSTIIPTWNEIDYLPNLLENLNSLAYISEIIVADNESTDGTAQFAMTAGCKVVTGGKPAVGRNAGAAVAQEALLLFVDADAIMTDDVMDALVENFQNQNVVAVHLRHKPLTTRRMIRFSYGVLDMYLLACSTLGRSYAVGTLIAVRKSAFESVGGFNEAVLVGEDFDFMRRLGQSKNGRIKYVRQRQLEVSARRFEVESFTIYVLKCLVWGTLRAIGTRHSLFGYKWMPYPRVEGAAADLCEVPEIRREPSDDSTSMRRS
jgi:glycosyltransferase involved in cell wall biosynthesis